jgi:hypothetical protein
MVINKFGDRKYLTGFLCLMFLNIFLVIFLLHSVFAQTSDNSSKTNISIKAEVIRQEDSPLSIIGISADSASDKQQIVSFSIQNISSKKITACVVLYSDETGSGGAGTRFFQSFIPGQIIQTSLSEANENIKLNGKLFVSIDYVEFEDGSIWGKDTQKQSEDISGFNAGQRSAVNQIKEMFVNQNKNALIDFLRKDIDEIDPAIIDIKKSKLWQTGYNTGYKSVLSRIQFAYQKQGMEAVSLKLEEIEKLMKREGR